MRSPVCSRGKVLSVMSYKRPSFYRHMDFVGNAALSVGDAFCDRCPSVEPSHEEESPGRSLNWGAHLRPHHFQFSEGSKVLLRVEGRRDVTCHAISVLGSGYFLESETANAAEFSNGAIIVKAGERYKLFSFEEFQSRFVLEDASPIETIFQINFQTPKK